MDAHDRGMVVDAMSLVEEANILAERMPDVAKAKALVAIADSLLWLREVVAELEAARLNC